MERADAKRQRLSHYETGRPCKNGHLSRRYVPTGACLECDREKLRREYKNPVERERRFIAHQKWVSENREYVRAYLAEWMKQNSGKVCAYSTKSRAAMLKRTPPWVDLDAILKFYAERPPGHHVDHIIPLQGKLVSGLHVRLNLQYLPDVENLSKNNKFDPMSFEGP